MNIKRMRLTREEKAIEAESLSYVPMAPDEFKMIVDAIKRHRKDAVLNMRVNSAVLNGIKKKAKKAGIPYQTLISETLHALAQP